MPRVIPPAPRPIKTDIELFARAYFNLELTTAQMEYIAILAGTGELKLVRHEKQRNIGKTTAIKVALAYLQAGIKTNGRARLPSWVPKVAKPGRAKLKSKPIMTRLTNNSKQRCTGRLSRKDSRDENCTPKEAHGC
jgi:hypothetical protein